MENGVWAGFNLTYYGFFSACAYVLATTVLCILLGSVAVPASTLLIMAAVMLGCCVPASRLIARFVEKKKYTFSVQGASFVGLLIAPWIIVLINRFTAIPNHNHPEVLVVLAAIAAAFALGEGIGRLSCISFGCCYGKPLNGMSPLFQKIFSHLYFVFYGKTKKIAYADGLDGTPMLPVQAITSIVLCMTGMAGIYLFLKGFLSPPLSVWSPPPRSGGFCPNLSGQITGAAAKYPLIRSWALPPLPTRLPLPGCFPLPCIPDTIF
ncbi:MAG: hypothetical protein R2874_03785 [Desulfobacterales bacterium]